MLKAEPSAELHYSAYNKVKNYYSQMAVSTFKKVELYQSGWILGTLLGLLFIEWFVRKLVRLK